LGHIACIAMSGSQEARERLCMDRIWTWNGKVLSLEERGIVRHGVPDLPIRLERKSSLSGRAARVIDADVAGDRWFAANKWAHRVWLRGDSLAMLDIMDGSDCAL
jgi:hypothetical protein